jgi:predicted lactoylglutathione lyase
MARMLARGARGLDGRLRAAVPAGEPMEQDGMYERSFQDPDGHLWEVFYMDPAPVPAG